ncbi:GntR family transcriptional regulator [Aminipila butyrica]|uniref:GntR family transcriptional regulator n=1 Tax=Aminipila butyrica TaxID=433296 RepID=A0A858BVE1_9FIRM|nr:GntR family transcriptional regulator [Aminipila butyrica]QIB70021.1 GntR family transcriptional regulator [Aminipila butyrica]
MVLYQHNEHAKSQNLPISNSLFSKLQKDILQGKMRSGEKLTEQSICDKYQVSRTPVREALRQLEMEGLIETIPNRGAFVIGFSPQDMADMYELRKAYEVQAVKWAIQRITDEEMEDLEETFEFMEFYTQKNDIDKMLNINTGFHQLIYTASHNRMLQHVLSSYQIYIKHSRRPTPYPENYLAEVLEEHRAIFEAFQNKDVEAGALAMTKHMEKSMSRPR